jgi:hypothetical protein
MVGGHSSALDLTDNSRHQANRRRIAIISTLLIRITTV